MAPAAVIAPTSFDMQCPPPLLLLAPALAASAAAALAAAAAHVDPAASLAANPRASCQLRALDQLAFHGHVDLVWPSRDEHMPLTSFSGDVDSSGKAERVLVQSFEP